MSKIEETLKYITQISGKCHFNRDEFQSQIELLQNFSFNEGLSESNIDCLVEFMTNTKLASSICTNLLHCFIPKTSVSNKSLEQILLWFFTEIGHERITGSVQKKFMQWLTGVTLYNLADTGIIDSYYHSFLFLLSKPHLESSVCKLLYLLSKPEDAKRWLVQQLLHIQTVSGLKSYSNSFMSLLKFYRSDIVPETVSFCNSYYSNSTFDEILKKAYLRKIENSMQSKNTNNFDNLHWNNWKIFDGKNKKLIRLIPPTESFNLDCKKKTSLQSLKDFKTMASLGFKLLQIKCPAQSLSFLINIIGYHALVFNDSIIQTRFSYRLYHTLCRVFLLELEPYSEKEKINFLNSIKGLQEYIQQSIPVVTTFLFNFLLIWNGEDYKNEILGLVEWIEMKDEDLQKYIFPPLQQIFLSSGTYCKCLIIETMRKLMHNLLVMEKREKNYFKHDFVEYNIIRSIEAITSFVSGLIINGLIWNNEKATRNILMSALDFYETSQAVEQAGDLPIIILMPPVLMYKCLFSGSRICIARLCSVLVQLQMNSVERLYSLGVFQDFATQVHQLNIYMLDCYRCLWTNITYCKNEDSFIFHENIFCEIFWRLKDNYGDLIDKIFCIEHNSSFWYPQRKGIREVSMVILNQLVEDFPSIIRLKQITENRLLQAF